MDLKFTISLILVHTAIICKTSGACNVTIVKYGPFQQSHYVHPVHFGQHSSQRVRYRGEKNSIVLERIRVQNKINRQRGVTS